MQALRTLWLNTGSLCNITCRNCYIDSSPDNDRLAYLTRAEAAAFLDEIARDAWPVREIGFTGGEPFMNPDIIDMLGDALSRGFSVLVLTNAMQPMLRPRIRDGLIGAARGAWQPPRLTREPRPLFGELHETERGPTGSFAKTIEGIDWLAREGFTLALAGRTCWGESEADARAGYAALIACTRLAGRCLRSRRSWFCSRRWTRAPTCPEITESCWGILGKDPNEVMCASSRMVVKRKGAASPVVLPCTLLALRSRLRDGRHAGAKPRAPTAACSTTARSSSAIRIAPSSACSAAGAVRPRASPA